MYTKGYTSNIPSSNKSIHQLNPSRQLNILKENIKIPVFFTTNNGTKPDAYIIQHKKIQQNYTTKLIRNIKQHEKEVNNSMNRYVYPMNIGKLNKVNKNTIISISRRNSLPFNNNPIFKQINYQVGQQIALKIGGSPSAKKLKRYQTQNLQPNTQIKKLKFPTINLKTISQNSQQKKFTMRQKRIEFKQYLKQKKQRKIQVLKKCYQNYFENQYKINRYQNNNKQSYHNMRRIKTQQQIQNQCMLERLLQIKPTQQVSRSMLEKRFQIHKNYKKHRKNSLNNIIMNRSFSLKKIKIQDKKSFIKL